MRALQRLRQYWLLFFLWGALVIIGIIGSFQEFVTLLQQFSNAPAIVEPLPTPQPKYFIEPSAVASSPAITARSVWIYDRNSHSVLYESQAQEATSVASLAKLMTAYVSYESFDLEKPIAIASASAAIGNRAKFRARDIFAVKDLLRALLVFSANDAAEALANAYPGGMPAFVQRMNERADEFRFGKLHFANPSGLDDPEQYASAEAIGRIADMVLTVPFLRDTVSKQIVEVREASTGRRDVVYTTNSLLARDAHIQGVKTGTTEMAGESYIARYVDVAAKPKPKDWIVVVLGSQDRFQEAQALLKWANQAAQYQNE